MLTIEGNIVNIDGVKRGRIKIGGFGLISKVGEPAGEADIILKDELIFPGFIDLHVHARECADHSWDYKEDFETAGQAAINGGVTEFADMPNNPVPPVDEASYLKKLELTKFTGPALLYAGIGPNTKPLANLLEIGHEVPYKVFMGPSIGNLFFSSLEQLKETLAGYRGKNISFHCEDPKILDENKNQSSHEKKRPPEAELSAVDFALELIEKYELKGKICHCSTVAALEKITQAKEHGLSVTVEVSPHHLFFDQSNINQANHAFMQMNPPLRSKKDRLGLIEALRDGKIDFLATDHAPHTVAEKEKGISGTPQLDTFGPFVTWLIKEHGFKPQEIMRVCSFNPGQWFSQFSSRNYGKVEEGFAGSLTVLDLNKPVTIEKSMLKTKCGWSPFEGFTFPGSVEYTIIHGKVYRH